MRLLPTPLALAALLALTTALLPAPLAHAQAAPGADALPTPTPTPRLPSLGDTENDDLGIKAERRLGDQIMRSIRPDPDVVDDPLEGEYLESIFRPLVNAARERGDLTPELDSSFGWETFLVRDRSFNAFALPGGFIGVHLGLIGASGSSDELASVLGHELSHITQRHIARSMASAKNQSVVTTAAMLLGLLASARSGNVDVPAAILTTGQAAMASGQLSFSREMEREADRFGLDVMTTAGFSPAGMAQMFERLDAASRIADSNQYPYLRSHPLTIERLAEARLRAHPAAAPEAPRVRVAEHAMMRARARVLMDPSEQALRRLQILGPQAGTMADAERLQAMYGAVLASIQLRDAAPAAAMLSATESLLAQWRASPRPSLPDIGNPALTRDLRLAAVDIALLRRDPAAIAAAVDALGEDASRPVLVARAEAAIARQVAGDAGGLAALRSSTEALQVWVSDHHADALAWQMLARTAEPIGLSLRAVRAEAEFHAAQGDLMGAIDRLRAGQRQARSGRPDFVEASIIDARLRELEGERRALMREQRGERGERGDREPG